VIRSALRVTSVRSVQVLLLAGCVACGSSTTAPSNTPPTATNTITITAAGTSPKNIQVAIGTRVTFVNSDSRSHNIADDPHPQHGDCPELQQIGFLSPGEKRESGNLVVARNCGYHDHDNPAATTLQGTITIK
jgi:plastocyanin